MLEQTRTQPSDNGGGGNFRQILDLLSGVI